MRAYGNEKVGIFHSSFVAQLPERLSPVLPEKKIDGFVTQYGRNCWPRFVVRCQWKVIAALFIL